MAREKKTMVANKRRGIMAAINVVVSVHVAWHMRSIKRRHKQA